MLLTLKKTITYFSEAKKQQKKITMLTAYDYPTAKLLDQAGIDSILVGDSVGNTVLGYKDTLSVTMQDMIHHGKAVVRGVQNALVIIDMPFMSYQTSVYDAVCKAGEIIKQTGATAVKLEGGIDVCPQIEAITKACIPVVAHLGLTPQAVNSFGGYKTQCTDENSAKKLLQDAKAVQQAGAFAVVLECIPSKLAALVTQILDIPTIGIGAGSYCDGQVLVFHDVVGMSFDFSPKFAKTYTQIDQAIKQAAQCYCDEVRQGQFPGEQHEYSIDDKIISNIMSEENLL